MKKQVLSQIDTLVKQFNKKNEKRGKVYAMSWNRFQRGHYSVKIEYSIFFSTDLEVLMKVITTNGLLMFLGTYNNSDIAYVSIQ